ncbi:gp50 protein [Mycobacteroides abscessus subsp. bolletii]|uniref:glycoside hydrolase family 25 protein n=1 Tax=Mycobacteroides abscessus TaxID=36809 RepID=UPI0009A5BAA5|nr:GH25 family lysozyme [Mycobacteroides abscessus]SLI26681.1 gp50 protein [Mycobacteroides abscessus subsp. bolletii]
MTEDVSGASGGDDLAGRGSLSGGLAPATVNSSVSSGPIFGIDISNNNGVVDLDSVKAEGFQFVWAKVSEGANFVDSDWPRTRDWCHRIGLLLAGYHYIREGDPQTQADNFVAQLGDPKIPAMLDFETGSGGIENFWAVKKAVESRGAAVRLSYIPRWYWQQIGSPDISGVPGLIQSSYVTGTGYASALYPGNDSTLWDGFGGKTVDILQFTDSAYVAGKQLDACAYRGSVDGLKRLLNIPLQGGDGPSISPQNL